MYKWYVLKFQQYIKNYTILHKLSLLVYTVHNILNPNKSQIEGQLTYQVEL